MEIHAHEVMRMMLETNTGYSRESLATAIIGRFGEEARFYACSLRGMNVGEVINFLETRGKFIARADGFNTAPDRICTHHDELPKSKPGDMPLAIDPNPS